MGFNRPGGFDIVHKAGSADFNPAGRLEQTRHMQYSLGIRSAVTRTLALLWVLALTLAASVAQGQGKEAFYRCKDANGQRHVGQSIPEPCMDLDIEVLDNRGRVIRTIPGRASRQNAAQREAEAEAAAEARAQAAQRDKTLLATYLSAEDIERLRDQRLELLEQQAQVTHQYIKNLREREARLLEDIQRFRPYSPNPNAPAVPEQLAEEIVSTVNGLEVYEEELAKNTAEQSRLREEFGADIARFKELRGE